MIPGGTTGGSTPIQSVSSPKATLIGIEPGALALTSRHTAGRARPQRAVERLLDVHNRRTRGHGGSRLDSRTDTHQELGHRIDFTTVYDNATSVAAAPHPSPTPGGEEPYRASKRGITKADGGVTGKPLFISPT